MNNIRCTNCGYFFHHQANFCPKCGKPYFYYSKKSNLVMILLCLFAGSFGLHRMYAGKIASGIMQFLLCLIIIGYIWLIIDFFTILFGSFRDSHGKIISW